MLLRQSCLETNEKSYAWSGSRGKYLPTMWKLGRYVNETKKTITINFFLLITTDFEMFSPEEILKENNHFICSYSYDTVHRIRIISVSVSFHPEQPHLSYVLCRGRGAPPLSYWQTGGGDLHICTVCRAYYRQHTGILGRLIPEVYSC